jgi:peptide/nickel transport system substrate-binding protein
VFFLVTCLGVCAIAGGALSAAGAGTSGGVAQIALLSVDVDSLDPALSYTEASGALVDTTCARLLGYSDRSLSSLHLEPEVASGFPRVSGDRRTFTFALRSGFRFSDGTPVESTAFARTINRDLAPALKSPFASYFADIVGADRVLAGKTDAATGIVARGLTLTIRLRRPVPDFLARTTNLCAVPPTLPADPEGVDQFPAAGPYYVSEYRAGEKVVIRRNPYYGGKRPHHVDGFDVDLRPTAYAELLDAIERGAADWGWAVSAAYFDPGRRLAAKYGVNKSRFFLTPGFGFFGFALNSSRPLFRGNPALRQAVNFAVDRTALRRLTGGLLASQPTDQYLPPPIPGYRDAHIYPLDRPDLVRARALARGHTRSGTAVLYTVARPDMIAAAQQVKSDLAKIGLDVHVTAIPKSAYFGRLAAGGPYDIGFQPWAPDYLDPYSILNLLFDGSFIGSTNWGRFDSPMYNRLLRHAASLTGEARYAAYGALDATLARDAAPMVAVSIANEPTLVSKRVGCIVLRPQLDLTSMCLR